MRELKPPNLEYVPRGKARRLIFRCDAPEVLIAGPAGTGKSLACLWKLHLCATQTAGVRCLVVRKTRESLTESALVTFERDVLPPGHPARLGADRPSRKIYRYPNGSEIVVGGFRQAGADATQKIMSTEYDLVYVQEAVELNEDEWERLTTRLRNYRLTYQQLLADTNPAAPTHWLKRRCDKGRTLLLESRHEDNPVYWDVDAAMWTGKGAEYIAKLDALTGPRLQRLRHGRWAAAEGLVYDGWDASIHVVDRDIFLAATQGTIPRDWPRYWSIDFGFTNPFVCQRWAQDPDGRLILYAETYRSQRLVEDHARDLLAVCGVVNGDWSLAREPKPRVIVCDHDAEDRATLTRHLVIGTTAAVKDVSPGIQAVAGRLRRSGDGKPRLVILRDALTRRDVALDAARKPTSTADEFDSYVWDVTAPGVATSVRKTGEVPVKRDDHGMDALRYMVFFLDGHRVAYGKTARPSPLWMETGPGTWGES